jgi:hypothetical protein
VIKCSFSTCMTKVTPVFAFIQKQRSISKTSSVRHHDTKSLTSQDIPGFLAALIGLKYENLSEHDLSNWNTRIQIAAKSQAMEQLTCVPEVTHKTSAHEARQLMKPCQQDFRNLHVVPRPQNPMRQRMLVACSPRFKDSHAVSMTLQI